MIEIVLPTLRSHYAELLDQMFRMRYDICIKKWGWVVPNQKPGLDIDEFDNDEAVYMLLLSDDRQDVIGCCRFNPTTSPYMISKLWPESCDLQAPPSDPAIWEASRFVVRGGMGSKEKYLEIMWRLSTGMCEFCVSAGIEKIVWYTDPPFYQTIASVMDTEPLGRPTYNADDDKTYISGTSKPNEDGIRRSRANLKDPDMNLTFALTPLGQPQLLFPFNQKKAA